MLLNKIPCLDKGFIAPLELSNVQAKLKALHPNDGILRASTYSTESATLLFKCPIFVQLNLSKFGFTTINVSPENIDAYIPDLTEVASGDVGTSKDIADDLERTTAALLINPKAYQADGCDKFIAQTIMPISTYTTIAITGTVRQWQEFYNQSGIPKPLAVYTETSRQIIEAHWPDLRNP